MSMMLLDNSDYITYNRFPGIQKPLDDYGCSTSSPPTSKAAAADDDDDFDLFGSDDEEEVSLFC